MSKTDRVEARVLPTRKQRYEKAAAVLRLENLGAFVRRACDDLADAVLEPTPSARIDAPGQAARQVKPDPRKKIR